MQTSQSSAWQVAVNILTRRDHSQAELVRKLKQRGFEADEIQLAITKAYEYDYLNDSRFASSYVRYRGDRGIGPQRLRGELRERQVSSELIEQAMNQAEQDWFELCLRVYQQKFRAPLPMDAKQRAKVYRFLISRGFSMDQIRYAIEADPQ